MRLPIASPPHTSFLVSKPHVHLFPRLPTKLSIDLPRNEHIIFLCYSSPLANPPSKLVLPGGLGGVSIASQESLRDGFESQHPNYLSDLKQDILPLSASAFLPIKWK